MLRIGLESTNAQPAYFHEPQQNQHNADRQAFILAVTRRASRDAQDDRPY